MAKPAFEVKKKKLLSTLTHFRSELTSSVFVLAALTILKLFPLFYITHQWKLTNFGLPNYLKFALVTTYLDKNDHVLTAVFILIYILSLITIVYVYQMYSVKRVNFLFKFFYMLIKILLYTHFIFVGYLYEIIFSFIFKDMCDLQTSICSNISSVRICFAVILLILVFIIKLGLSFLIRKPHFIQPYLFVGKLNSYNFENIILSILQGIIILENYLPFEPILIIKIIIRTLFSIYYIRYIINYYLIINRVEFFIKTMAFISVLLEFIFLKDFFNMNLTDLVSNPSNVSLLLEDNFSDKKLLLEFCLSLIFYFFLQKKVYKRDPTCFYLTKNNGNIFFTFYNKLFQFLLKIQNNKIKIVDLFNQIIEHKKTCEVEDCYCHNLIEKYHNLIEKNNYDKKSEIIAQKLYDLILKEIETILKNLIEKTNNDSADNFQVLFIFILFSIYFGKHYIQSFFTIQKIEKSTIYRKNFITQLQIHFIKHELVSDFIKHNKQTANVDYTLMHMSYKECSRYMKIEASILQTIERYKELSRSVLNKQLTSEDYGKLIGKFYKCLERSYNLLDKDLKFHSQNFSNIKLLYFLKFFDSEKFAYLKNDKYFIVSADSARAHLPADVMIIKHTKTNNDYIIEFVTPILCENLHYSMFDVVGREIHEFMPDGFREEHYNHMYRYISNNNMTVKNKEIFFIDGHGYMVMHTISGSVMLTLKQELYIYAEFVCLRDLYENRGTSYLCLSDEGNILKLNKRFEDLFIYKHAISKVLKVNFFNDIIGVKKDDIDWEREDECYTFETTYDEIMQKFKKLDYSKLWDSDNLFYITYMENLKEFNYPRSKITVRIERKNFMRKFFFFFVKLTIHQGFKRIMFSNNLIQITKTDISDEMKSPDEHKSAKNVLEKIKHSAYQVLSKDQSIEIDLGVKQNIYQEQLIKTRFKKKEFSCRSFTYVLFVLFTFISGTIVLEYFKLAIFKYADTLSTINLEMYNVNIYTKYLRSYTIDIFVDNEIESNKKFIDTLLNKYRLLIKKVDINYFSLSSELGEQYHPIFKTQFNITELNLDWTIRTTPVNLFDIFDRLKRHSYRIISNDNFTISFENYAQLYHYDIMQASYQDQGIVFVLENGSLKNLFDMFSDINLSVSQDFLNSAKKYFITINSIIIFLLFVSIIYSLKEYFGDQTQVYNRLFIVFNILKFYNMYLLSKIVTFEDLFKEFTIKNKRRLKELNLDKKDFKELKSQCTDYIEKVEGKSNAGGNIDFKRGELNNNVVKSHMKMKELSEALKAENSNLSSFNRTQSMFLGNKSKDMTASGNGANDSANKYLIHSDMLRKSKKHYLFFTIYLFTSIITLLLCTTISFMILVQFDQIYNNEENVYIYFNKHKNIYEMVLTYQSSLLKRIEVLDADGTVQFDNLKAKHFYYKDLFNDIQANDRFTINNLKQFENSLANNDLCNLLANYTEGFSVPDCQTMANGINTKGYSNMIDTMYQVLFFLYSDLSYLIKNKINYSIRDIVTKPEYIRIMDNYKTILYELSNIIITLLIEDQSESIGYINSWEDILIGCLSLETIIILLFFTIFYRSADSRIKMLNKFEKIVENTIFCSI
jgi:PAS domain-containing protein